LAVGGDVQRILYIGTLDDNWAPVHSAPLRSGGSTEALLHTIERF
jgi:hypothetical protein